MAWPPLWTPHSRLEPEELQQPEGVGMFLVGDVGVDIIMAPERSGEDAKREHCRARAGFDYGLVSGLGLAPEHLKRWVAAN